MAYKRGRKSNGSKGLLFIVLILVGWGAYELLPGLFTKSDPLYLLYDTSRFHAEMVTQHLNAAAQSDSTKNLDSLMQSLYSFRYIHNRLSEATGGDIPMLSSQSALIDLIFRWQLGGVRALSDEEKGLLRTLHTEYIQWFISYQQLMSGTSINQSFNQQIMDLDKKLTGMIEAWGRK